LIVTYLKYRLNYLLFYLGWIVSKVKAVAPALPAAEATTPIPSVNDGSPKAIVGPVAIPSGEKPITKRPRGRGRKKPTNPNIAGTTPSSKTNDDDDDEVSNAEKPSLKRVLRALIQ
jgi:hypothetical protein